jgi:transcriptional regulator with XRE-family HTH domain
MSRPLSGFVAELAAARRVQGLSLAQVAERAGVASRSVVSHWETGRCEPSSHCLAAWAAALGPRLVPAPAGAPATNGELAAFLYDLIEQKPPKRPDIPPSPTVIDELFQDLIGALAQLFDEDAEAAPKQEAA